MSQRHILSDVTTQNVSAARPVARRRRSTTVARSASAPQQASSDATHHPRFSLLSPSYQNRRDGFEREHTLEGERLDAFEDSVTNVYLTERARACKRFITQSKLRNGRRQRELATEMQLDRSAFSVALNHGDLGSDPLANMLCDPLVLQDLSQRGLHLLRQCGRAGLIGATRAAAAFCDLKLVPSQLDVGLYERICRAVDRAHGEVPADDDMDDAAARWLDVLLYTTATVEGLGSELLWWQENDGQPI